MKSLLVLFLTSVSFLLEGCSTTGRVSLVSFNLVWEEGYQQNNPNYYRGEPYSYYEGVQPPYGYQGYSNPQMPYGYQGYNNLQPQQHHRIH